jgi:hypothetical protein
VFELTQFRWVDLGHSVFLVLNLCHAVIVPVRELLLLLYGLRWLPLAVGLRLVMAVGLRFVLQTTVTGIVRGVSFVVFLNCLLVHGLWRIQNQTELDRALMSDLLALNNRSESRLRHLVVHED